MKSQGSFRKIYELPQAIKSFRRRKESLLLNCETKTKKETNDLEIKNSKKPFSMQLKEKKEAEELLK